MDMRAHVAHALCFGTLVLAAPISITRESTKATDTAINAPSALASDNHGHLFLIEMHENKVLRIDLQAGTISTVAGNGKKCAYKNGTKAAEVCLDFIQSIAVDSHGNVFIGEYNQILMVDANTGLISIIAGDGTPGNTVSGTDVRSVHFWGINGMAVGLDGNLFAADQHQGKIFKIDTKKGTFQDYAGSGIFGYGGDGGLAIHASFRFPSGLATDRAGNLVVADFENCAIRRIDRETGIVKTIAITGGVEQNCVDRPDNSRPGAFPSDPAVDPDGNIYFVEGAMDFVKRIDSSTSAVSVFAGNGHRGFTGDNGVATDAELNNPSGLAIDLEGNVFIAEYVNNRVRRVDAKTKVITTIAGNGLPHRIDFMM